MILLSIFRNSERYLDRYISQVKALRELEDVRVIAVEGDSTDDTYARLLDTDFTALKVEHGGPFFESLNRPLRWRQIAAVCNVGMVAAQRDLLPNEPLLYVESDLIWKPETLVKLIDHTEKYPAVTCLSMRGARFYDTFGYTANGKRFGPWPPYFEGGSTAHMHKIDSCGSVIAMSYDTAQVAFFGHTDCIIGLGQSIRDAGLSLWIDPTLKVIHE